MSAIFSWTSSQTLRIFWLMTPEYMTSTGMKLTLTSPSLQSLTNRMTATATRSTKKYGERTRPIWMNMRMLSTSVMARDMSAPVW